MTSAKALEHENSFYVWGIAAKIGGGVNSQVTRGPGTQCVGGSPSARNTAP